MRERTRGKRRIAWRAWAASTLLATLPGCFLIEYSDDLVDATTGRTNLVIKPAAFGGVVGFVVGLPLDLILLPATYVVYQSQKEDGEEGLDPTSTLLFPSWALKVTGILLIGTPLDLVEYTLYRAWQSAPPPTQVELDRRLDTPPPSKQPAERDA